MSGIDRGAVRRPPGRRGALPSLATILLGVSLLATLLGVSAFAGSGSFSSSSARSGPPGSVSGPACGVAPARACEIDAVGSGWSILPPSDWCTYNTTASTIWNGTVVNSTMADCAPAVGLIDFNMTWNGTLAGSIAATGPFAIWLVPSSEECDLVSTIGHMAWPCPPPFGPSSP
ncbi:MAG: hypothetical protein L3J73_03960, partial [Thermoplasmata archaeon]|nr:hypothetical protein [Thermoplasmata archaeon]